MSGGKAPIANVVRPLKMDARGYVAKCGSKGSRYPKMLLKNNSSNIGSNWKTAFFILIFYYMTGNEIK